MAWEFSSQGRLILALTWVRNMHEIFLARSVKKSPKLLNDVTFIS